MLSVRAWIVVAVLVMALAATSVFASSVDSALVAEDHSEFSADIASFIEASSLSQADSDSDSEEAADTETETEQAVDADAEIDAEAEEALDAMRRGAVKRALVKGKAAVKRVAAKAAAVVKAVAAKAKSAVKKAVKAVKGKKAAKKSKKSKKAGKKSKKSKKGKKGAKKAGKKGKKGGKKSKKSKKSKKAKKAKKGKKSKKSKKSKKGKKAGKKGKKGKKQSKKARKLRKQLRKLKKGGASRKAIGRVQASLKALKKGPVSIAVKQHRIKLKGRTPGPKKQKIHRESPTDRNYVKHLRATKKQWASRIKNLKAKIATLGRPVGGMNDWEIEYSTLDPQDTSQAAMAKELIDEYKPFLKDAKSIKEDDLNNGKHQLVVMEKLRWEVRNKLEKAQDTPLLPEQYRFIE